MIVNVTGYRKLLRMTLPVLDDSADVAYQRRHRKMNLMFAGAGARLRILRIDHVFSSNEAPDSDEPRGYGFENDGRPLSCPIPFIRVFVPGIDLRRREESKVSEEARY